MRTRWLGTTLLLLITEVNVSLSFAHEIEDSSLGSSVTGKAQELVEAYQEHPDRFKESRRLIFDFNSEKRTTIDFFPLVYQTETGVSIGSMTYEPRLATHALLREVLSGEGYLRVHTIQSLEKELRFDTTGVTGRRQSDNYAIQLFGEPVMDSPWGMKYQGHHLSLNFTVVDGEVRGTPLFLGANPAEIRSGSRLGLRVMGPQTDLAWSLLKSLSKEQRSKAFQEQGTLKSTPRGSLPAIESITGLSGAELSDRQQKLLFAICSSYFDTLHPALSHKESKRLRDADIGKIHFLWQGSDQPDEEHYFRVHGPTVLIEYHTLDGNHVHSLWRNPERDFGRDLLREHYHNEHVPH